MLTFIKGYFLVALFISSANSQLLLKLVNQHLATQLKKMNDKLETTQQIKKHEELHKIVDKDTKHKDTEDEDTTKDVEEDDDDNEEYLVEDEDGNIMLLVASKGSNKKDNEDDEEDVDLDDEEDDDEYKLYEDDDVDEEDDDLGRGHAKRKIKKKVHLINNMTPFRKFTRIIRRGMKHPKRTFKKVLKTILLPKTLNGIVAGSLLSNAVGFSAGSLAGATAGTIAGGLATGMFRKLDENGEPDRRSSRINDDRKPVILLVAIPKYSA